MSNVNAPTNQISRIMNDNRVSKPELKELRDLIAKDSLSLSHTVLHEILDSGKGILTESQTKALTRFDENIREAHQATGSGFYDAATFVGCRINPFSWVINGHLPFTLPDSVK